jgi:gas vesicle protein
MTTNNNTSKRLHEASVLQGFLVGFLVGALLWLWRLPQRGAANRERLVNAPRDLREKLDATEAVSQSIAEGKALAQQRKQQPSS